MTPLERTHSAPACTSNPAHLSFDSVPKAAFLGIVHTSTNESEESADIARGDDSDCGGHNLMDLDQSQQPEPDIPRRQMYENATPFLGHLIRMG